MRSLAKFEVKNPLLNLFNVKTDVGNVLDSFFCDSGFFEQRTNYPLVDITEDKDKYLIEVETPGMKQDNIDVVLRDNVLTIKGEKKCEHKSDDDGIHQIERSYGSFSRSFSIPHEVKADAINATYKDGMLNITLPKEEERKPKEIEIKVE